MRLHWLQAAISDLEAIGDYLRLHSPSAAERITGRIVNAVDHLADRPNIGRPGRVLETRELVVLGTPYIVAYRVRGQAVELLGVIHGARQWPESFD